MNRLIAIALATLALAGCATTSTRVSTPLSASEFNSVASQYMSRPTFVRLTGNSEDPTNNLIIEIDTYGSGYNTSLRMHLPTLIVLEREHVAEYLDLMDTYDRWRELAIENGDAIDRRVGIAGDKAFRFYSGNSASHYLVIEECSIGTCASDPMGSGLTSLFFDASNVAHLRRLLADWQAGRLTQLDEDAVYTR